jgi:hypothetical protein
MGLISEEVEVGLGGINKKLFKEKGYDIPSISNKNTKIRVKVTDLPDGSSAKVECKCDGCESVTEIEWRQYKIKVKSDNKTYCHKCSHQLFAGEKCRKSKLENSISFEQWCIDNNKQDILDRWDYKLNKYNPNEISYSTKIKCWIKCPLGIHTSELKTIQSITRDNSKNLCNQCNSFAQYLIDTYGNNALELYWSNKNTINPFEISHLSGVKVWLICQNCNNEKLIDPHTYVRYGIMCPGCSDGFSYPNKFAFNLLEQLGLDFIPEYSPDWIKPKKYDFYFELNDKKYIIEMDGGLGHGNKVYSNSKITIAETLEVDRFKDQLAQENNINMIRINCYYDLNDRFNYIKDNISNNENLNKIFDLSNIIGMNATKTHVIV